MSRTFQLIALALVTLALAGAASTFAALPFLPALTLVAAGILASGFIHSAGKAPGPEGGGAGALARTGIALTARLVIGTAVLVLMLLSMLWSLGATQ